MILVTGAGGFVGSVLISELTRRGICHRGAARKESGASFGIGSIGPLTDWSVVLGGVDTIVHLAWFAHAVHSIGADGANVLSANVEATLNLARQAERAGVKRFVFVSSIKVNGEATLPGRPFTADDAPNPQNAYAQSKLDAEQGLFALSRQTGLEVTVIRPPLVYGPGVKGNFAIMMEWVRRGIPLPLGAVHNKRSFAFVDNLADLIILAAGHPGAAGQVFLVSDGEDISTTELLQRMAQALGRPARIVPVPAPALTLAATALGQRAVVNRLIDSLQVDIGKTRELLGWAPGKSMAEGLQQAARAVRGAVLALDPVARSA